LLYGDVREWLKHGVRVINEYGPTEATVGCCVFQADTFLEADGSVPIGKPIANVEVYVLDGYLSPVPRGVAGELYVGGLGLARGYWQAPGLTAERFVADPFSGRNGARLYRTGDLARWKRNGNLEFLGRVGHQVKIRGFRIELGEIEATIAKHPSVRESAAVVREFAPGDTRIVAFVSLRADRQAIDVSELRKFIGEFLPDYMMPAQIDIMEKLPLTANGKVDQDRLPVVSAPEPAQPEAPRTATEQALTRIWRDVLRVNRIGLDANFFDLGGHSLLIPPLRAAIQREFQRTISVVEFFVYPTVRDMARHLDETAAPERDTDKSSVRASRRRAYLQDQQDRSRSRPEPKLPS